MNLLGWNSGSGCRRETSVVVLCYKHAARIAAYDTRICADPWLFVSTLLGEATFHQICGSDQFADASTLDRRIASATGAEVDRAF
jgi:hypothetical protein